MSHIAKLWHTTCNIYIKSHSTITMYTIQLSIIKIENHGGIVT